MNKNKSTNVVVFSHFVRLKTSTVDTENWLFFDYKTMPAGFLPTRETQIYQIFAANTNVGKTILTTGLCRAATTSANQHDCNVLYLKPIQTGSNSDER